MVWSNKLRDRKLSPNVSDKVSASAFFTLLVRNGAGGFAGRLTGRLTLAAAALDGAFFQIGLIQCFDVFHFKLPRNQRIGIKYLY